MKKLDKTTKNCFFGAQFALKESARATPKIKHFFLAKITIADHQLSETFYFQSISMHDRCAKKIHKSYMQGSYFMSPQLEQGVEYLSIALLESYKLLP